MFHRVRERLAGDVVCGGLDLGASTRSDGVMTTCAPSSRARRSSGPSRRCSLRVRVEDGHQPVGLGKRLDTSGANGREVAGRIVVVPGIGKPSSSCLDDHESEVMRHDVMQVARDSRTLPLHR